MIQYGALSSFTTPLSLIVPKRMHDPNFSKPTLSGCFFICLATRAGLCVSHPLTPSVPSCNLVSSLRLHLESSELWQTSDDPRFKLFETDAIARILVLFGDEDVDVRQSSMKAITAMFPLGGSLIQARHLKLISGRRRTDEAPRKQYCQTFSQPFSRLQLACSADVC